MDDDNPPCKLLVRTLKHLMPNKMFGMEFNFHLIDLKMKKIELNYIPAIPMMNGGAIGKMAMLESESDSCIYILGAVLNPTVLNQSKKKYEEEEEDEEEDMIHFHCESSKYSLVSKRWDAFDFPVQTHRRSIPSTIFGKWYFFGSPCCPPKVFENGWKDLELPTHLVHRKVDFPVIPDRINNRYLVHFFDSGEIYAFHPNSPSSDTTKAASASAAGDWTCVVDNFNEQWSPPMAVSGNILFFHVFMIPSLITAYDMSTNKWLEIVGDFTRVGETVSHYGDLFTLPGNHDVLCLASGLPITCDNPASVRILRLRFNHTIGSNQLTLTALDYQSYDIPIPSRADDFLLL